MLALNFNELHRLNEERSRLIRNRELIQAALEEVEEELEKDMANGNGIYIQNKDDIFLGNQFEYESWRFRLEVVLDEKNILDILKDEAKRAEWKQAKEAGVIPDALKPTDQANKKGRVIVLNCINLSEQRRIGAARLTAAEMLKALETIYHRTSDVALGTLKQEIVTSL